MAKIPVDMGSTKWKLDHSNFSLEKFKYEFTVDGIVRDYSGMSGIGNKCLRALQYSSRMVSKSEQTPSRIQRIFDLGHLLEEYIVQNLIYIGIEVSDQQKEVIGFAGHWKGHFDGTALNVPEAPKTKHLLEVKTHNDKSFKGVVKDGIAKSKPSHFAQMQRYMKADKLSRGLYIAYNKNDSTYYAERIYFNDKYASDLERKEQEVLLSEKLFPRISNKPSWFECKFCNHNKVCFDKLDINVNCRTCAHVDMLSNGAWECGLDNKKLSYTEQKLACDMYELYEMLRY